MISKKTFWTQFLWLWLKGFITWKKYIFWLKPNLNGCFSLSAFVVVDTFLCCFHLSRRPRHHSLSSGIQLSPCELSKGKPPSAMPWRVFFWVIAKQDIFHQVQQLDTFGKDLPSFKIYFTRFAFFDLDFFLPSLGLPVMHVSAFVCGVCVSVLCVRAHNSVFSCLAEPAAPVPTLSCSKAHGHIMETARAVRMTSSRRRVLYVSLRVFSFSILLFFLVTSKSSKQKKDRLWWRRLNPGIEPLMWNCPKAEWTRLTHWRFRVAATKNNTTLNDKWLHSGATSF